MNAYDKKLLKQKILAEYKRMMQKVYIDFTQYKPTQIRLEVLKILTDHILQKTNTEVVAKDRTIKKLKLQKRENINVVEKQQEKQENIEKSVFRYVI